MIKEIGYYCSRVSQHLLYTSYNGLSKLLSDKNDGGKKKQRKNEWREFKRPPIKINISRQIGNVSFENKKKSKFIYI